MKNDRATATVSSNHAVPTGSQSQLSGKIAVVTGASGGVGLCVAEVLAREGAGVVAADVRSLDDAVAAIERHGMVALGVPTDVSDADAVRNLAERTVSTFGGVDILVCCAAVYGGGDFETADLTEWSRVININLLGTYLCLREFFPRLRERGGGKVVCIGSIAGKSGGVLTGPHYAASKGGVHALCKWAAKNGAPDIYVNVVVPGVIATDMIKGKPYRDDVSLLKRQGSPKEVAEAVLYLASDASNYTTGTLHEVDGGLTQ